MNTPYDDIINLPRHVSESHPPMAMENRAAQFAPFSALTGHDSAIAEASRITHRQIELTDDRANILSRRLNYVLSLPVRPRICIIYFAPDAKKNGGHYRSLRSIVKRVDYAEGNIVLENNHTIPLSNVVDIRSNIFDDIDP